MSAPWIQVLAGQWVTQCPHGRFSHSHVLPTDIVGPLPGFLRSRLTAYFLYCVKYDWIVFSCLISRLAIYIPTAMSFFNLITTRFCVFTIKSCSLTDSLAESLCHDIDSL